MTRNERKKSPREMRWCHPVKALRRKLLRDLWGIKGQALAISMVIVSGVATFVISLSALDSLRETRAVFYREYRFAGLFASLKRAPESLADAVGDVPGVDRVETRVVATANIDLEAFPEPVRGLLISVPDGTAPLLNDLYLMRGRPVAEGRDDEVVASDAFALAHRIFAGLQRKRREHQCPRRRFAVPRASSAYTS